MSIGKLWAGKLFGTNTGNIFIELNGADGEFNGIARFMDDRFGLVLYELAGSFDGTRIKFTGRCTQAHEGVNTGDVTATGLLTPEGQLRGQWSSTTGTGGTFILLPHDSASEQLPAAPGLLPERLHTATRKIGAVRLYADDLTELINFLSKDFNQGRVIVTYRERGSEISRYASDVVNDFTRLGELRYLRISLQEPEAYGINRVAVVELNAEGENDVRVQGVQESWVIGKAESVSSWLRQRQKLLATTARSFGLNINMILTVGAIVALPELSLGKRVVFVIVVALIIWFIVKAHARFIPNAVIYLSERKPTVLEQSWPQLLSWFIALTSALAASIAYGLLKGELAWFTFWAH